MARDRRPSLDGEPHARTIVDMTGPNKRPPRPRPRLEATVADPVLTKTLADRVRREVAYERASDVELTSTDDGEAPVVVVLGPDGVPQIADPVDEAPETIRVDLDETPPK
jgi:hypothetical protein